MKSYMTILIIMILLALGIVGVCRADWYVVDQNNKVVVRTGYQPDQKDLDTRGEVAIFSKEKIRLSEAEYRGNKIVKKKKTQAEEKIEKDRLEKEQEMKIIKNKMMKLSYETLKQEGKAFKHVKPSDFE